MSRFRRVVVLHKHFRDIWREDKLVEFRSCNVALRFVPGLLVLFCLGARWRRRGMETMLLAEVLEIVDLPCREACLRFPKEAGACKLSHMARCWTGGKVRCIVLSRARPATEYVNLSAGCLGFVGQFESTTGTPRFCHRDDLHKAMAVTLNSRLTVSIILKRSWPLTVNSNPRRPVEGIEGGGVGTAVEVDGGGDGSLHFQMLWDAKNEPDPIVGKAPYATAKGEFKGYQMTFRPVKVPENGSCAYVAMILSIYFLLKNKNTAVLLDRLDVVECTRVNIVAAYGKKIVESDKALSEQDREKLANATKFREMIATHFCDNKSKFYEYFKDKNPGDYGGTSCTVPVAQSWSAVSKRWSDFIKSSYWDNVLAKILEDLFPSLSIVLLVSEKPLLGGMGHLWFYDEEYHQVLTSKVEKMRIVLHFISPAVRRPYSCHNLRPRSIGTSDFNHYEPVQLEVDPRFHFPAMDQASRTKPTGQ